MPNPLQRIKFRDSISKPPAAWAFDNTKDEATASRLFYALTVPYRRHAFLNDFNTGEEMEFWDLTFSIAREAANRLSRDTAPVRIIIGLNDGLYAGQTIAHAHAHIFALHPKTERFDDNAEQRPNITRALDSLSKEFRRTLTDSTFEQFATTPLAREPISFKGSDVVDFTLRLRDIRESLARQHGATQFRFHSASPVLPGDEDMDFCIEACTAEKPQYSISVTGRIWNDLKQVRDLRWSFRPSPFDTFEPLEPSTVSG